jgi:hypothetical protein
MHEQRLSQQAVGLDAFRMGKPLTVLRKMETLKRPVSPQNGGRRFAECFIAGSEP